MNCFSTNLIEIIGYQIEKVHSGILAWLINSKNTQIPIEKKVDLINKISSKKIDSYPDTIKTYLEWAKGRSIKVDLVIECKYENVTKVLGLEFKVDSIPNKEQLEITERILKKEYRDADIEVILVLMGVSAKATRDCDVGKYKIIRLNDFLSYLDDVHIQNIEIWKEAIEAELQRHKKILAEIQKSDSIWSLKEELIDKGYRWPFPVFYLLYAILRDDFLKSNDWAIYSGSNNPVMNAKDSWKEIDGVDIYVEFCWESLFIKCGNWDLKKDKDWIKRLRENVYQEMRERMGSEVERCQNRYGKSNSLCKISFNFAKTPFEKIAEKTKRFLSEYLTIVEGIEAKVK
ncbi:hypothetical protein DRI50_11985 [candidate division KSB1 bacterium]|nr:MAG: hypothetical protein DRI50_11985 [candidate division KSB1 bacterium]